MNERLREVVARNRAGETVAIPSVCSAQPDVLRATLLLAQERDRSVVIEATSNQVNQDGGYTGMRAKDFVAMVQGIADAANVDRSRIVFGGDHLGPQAWRNLPASNAMAKARKLVAEYVAAGFSKIHLDCSEGCAGEPGQLTDDQTAERSADLARVCAETAEDLLFVVGTEVPPPGGARIEEDGAVAPTEPHAARATMSAHLDSFGDLSDKIGGLVVQPGVEFSPSSVHAFPLDNDPGLKDAIAACPGVTLEAHSTDYQDAAVYPRLAELGFGFQKVGPALTFAYRAALYQLDAAVAQAQGSAPVLPDVMEKIMLADPANWQAHYRGDAATLKHLRHHGLADRIRYYLPHPDAQRATATLMATSMTEKQLQTHVPVATLDRASGLQGSLAERVVTAAIQEALAPYFFGAAV